MSKIEQQVMAGVAVVYTGRQLISAVALKLYALLATAIALWQLTWVHKVFQNLASAEHRGLGATGRYLVVAVEHTHLATQLTLFIAAAIIVSFAVDFFKTPATYSRFA